MNFINRFSTFVNVYYKVYKYIFNLRIQCNKLNFFSIFIDIWKLFDL